MKNKYGMREVVKQEKRGIKEYRIVLDQEIYQVELVEAGTILCIKVFRDLLSSIESGERWII